MNKIIEVRNISKSYKLGRGSRYLSLRDTLTILIRNLFLKKNRRLKKTFWALRDINFSIDKGDSLGIIGPNGAGKSTILKILSRITYPTEGEVIIRGRVASLLEVGTGFHPELSGRENIYLNGSILGLKKKEIEDGFSSIVSFSGIGKFIDTQVKHYSTGMHARLAFSIAAHIDPEILIVDEVLAVGDLSFQKKSLDKINQIGKSGKTIIFVSHNMSAISKICKKVIWLDKGKIVEIGSADKVIQDYISSVNMGIRSSRMLLNKKIYKHNIGLDLFKFKSIKVKSLKKNKKEIRSKEPFRIQIEGIAFKDLENFSIGFGLTNQSEAHLFNSYTVDSNLPTEYKKGVIKFDVTMDPNLLVPGRYRIDLVALGSGISEWIPEAFDFNILDASTDKNIRLNAGGIISYPAVWKNE